MNRQTNIRIVDEQSEEVKSNAYDISETEKEALLAKYYPEQYKKKYIEPERKIRTPKPHQKRNQEDYGTQKSSNEYYDVRFQNLDAGEDSLNLKIEIRSDMKLK